LSARGSELEADLHSASCGNCSSGDWQAPERASAHHYSAGPPLR
jgi:hypothetical protein